MGEQLRPSEENLEPQINVGNKKSLKELRIEGDALMNEFGRTRDPKEMKRIMDQMAVVKKQIVEAMQESQKRVHKLDKDLEKAKKKMNEAFKRGGVDPKDFGL